MSQRWIVSVHQGGGSMAEAADSAFAFIMDEPDAQALEKRINDRIAASSSQYVAEEWWAMAYPEDTTVGLNDAFNQVEQRLKEDE